MRLKLEDSVVLGTSYLISQSLYSHLKNEDDNDNTDLKGLYFNKLQPQKLILIKNRFIERILVGSQNCWKHWKMRGYTQIEQCSKTSSRICCYCQVPTAAACPPTTTGTGNWMFFLFPLSPQKLYVAATLTHHSQKELSTVSASLCHWLPVQSPSQVHLLDQPRL